MSVAIRFLPNDVIVQAEPGESLLAVAERVGVSIPTGCLMGSCHACEVDIQEIGEVRACITAVPAGHTHLTVNIFVDPTW
ncbi:MAG: 2Fe-2S iron-sulfur cluster-binding protein [Leptolyngbyaceae bacterium]|nr:2Fe-2S iron-sulfur cluster-binding protein [Leptolyngbyaceae bacterium]